MPLVPGVMELKIYNEALRAVFADCCSPGEGGYQPGCDCRCCTQYKAELGFGLVRFR